MQLRSALLAATVLATPFAASAQPVTGLYVGAGAGVNIMQKEDIRGARLGFPGAVVAANTTGSYKGSVGFAGVFSVGWGFGNGLRAEVEGNYRGNHNNGISGSSFGGANGSNFEQKYGGMVNALYDFNGLTPWLVPYIGVGVGYVAVNDKWKVYNTGATTVGGLAGTFAPGAINAGGMQTKGAFAYQAILGGAVPLNSISPGLAFTAEYRFFGTTGNRNYGGTITAVNAAGAQVAAAPSGINLGSSYNHSIMLGFRYNFGVAPPPPPQAPRYRLRHLRVPTWCSSIGTGRRSPIVRARSSRKPPTTRRACSTRGSK